MPSCCTTCTARALTFERRENWRCCMLAAAAAAVGLLKANWLKAAAGLPPAWALASPAGSKEGGCMLVQPSNFLATRLGVGLLEGVVLRDAAQRSTDARKHTCTFMHTHSQLVHASFTVVPSPTHLLLTWACAPMGCVEHGIQHAC